jgi:hypothetical protein
MSCESGSSRSTSRSVHAASLAGGVELDDLLEAVVGEAVEDHAGSESRAGTLAVVSGYAVGGGLLPNNES